MVKSPVYKNPAESVTIKTEVVCPNDTNPMGILQGGRLVEWMDIAAAVCAQLHAGKICVTASINRVDFNAAAKIGDIIHIKAVITRAFNSSMEIFVQAYSNKFMVGTKLLISEAYFNFVALDTDGKATSVIPVKAETLPEKKQFAAALVRRNEKLKERKSPVV